MADSPRGLPVKSTIRPNRLGKVMAKAMKASVDTAALSQVSREIDVTALQILRRRQPAQAEIRLSLNTLLMAAVARTLPAHPLLNAELVEGQILVYDTVNLGMAVAVRDGLIVVVIPEAHRLSLVELAQAIEARAERARTGALSMTDVEGGTFTVSNLGMYGIDSGFPLPRPPEGAILLMGSVRPRPAVVEGEVTVREIAWFTLTFDHRFIDGATAAAFLQDLNEALQSPESLLETAESRE